MTAAAKACFRLSVHKFRWFNGASLDQTQCDKQRPQCYTTSSKHRAISASKFESKKNSQPVSLSNSSYASSCLSQLRVSSVGASCEHSSSTLSVVSSGSSFMSVTALLTSAFVQSSPWQCPQAAMHFRPFLRHVHCFEEQLPALEYCT